MSVVHYLPPRLLIVPPVAPPEPDLAALTAEASLRAEQRLCGRWRVAALLLGFWCAVGWAAVLMAWRATL